MPSHCREDITKLSIQVSIKTGYDICMYPIVKVIQPITSMNHIWSKVMDEEEDEDDYEIYGQLE